MAALRGSRSIKQTDETRQGTDATRLRLTPDIEHGSLQVWVREQVGSDNFDRYFSSCLAIEQSGAVLEIKAPTAFHASLLERRFGENLRSAASRVSGQGVVRFQAADDVIAPVQRIDHNKNRQLTPSPVAGAKSTPCQATLDEFLVGESNRLAYGGAAAISDPSPTRASRIGILVLHGACGVGKTHLLRATAAQYQAAMPGALVRCTTGEAFTNEFILAVKHNRVDQFRRTYRRADLLCIDDVHFLTNKSATQAELLHTFDAADSAGMRVVLASDEHPRLISRFSEALVSRFLSGLVAEIQAPDESLRARLLATFAQRRGLNLEPEASRALLTHFNACINRGEPVTAREINGLLQQLCVLARVTRVEESGGRIGMHLINMALSRTGAMTGFTTGSTSPRPIAMARIIKAVCEQLGVAEADFGGTGRHKQVVLARSMASYLARKFTTLSFPEIARAMGRPNHSTIIAASRRFEHLLTTGREAGSLPESSLGALCARIESVICSGRAPT